MRCQYYALTPLWVDYMKDELTENFEYATKIAVFHTICAVILGVEYYFIATRDPDVIARVSALI